MSIVLFGYSNSTAFRPRAPKHLRRPPGNGDFTNGDINNGSSQHCSVFVLSKSWLTLSCGDANPIALPFNVIEIKRYPRKAAHQRIAFFVELVDGKREKVFARCNSDPVTLLERAHWSFCH